ncbi:MAG: DUF1653 domain-containing protein [Bacteroidales bacterium]|nr:DUF1653 domain-containing protein [Bacteroidales bacterium]
MQYFRHYKGNYYRLVSEARHSETLEDMVVYQAMYGKMEIWVRPKKMFFESVQLTNGEIVPRFAPCSEQEAVNSMVTGKDEQYENLVNSLYGIFDEKGYSAEDFSGGCSLCGEENEFALDEIFAEVKRAIADIDDEKAEALTKKIYIELHQRFDDKD